MLLKSVITLILLISCSTLLADPAHEKATARYFETIKNDPTALRIFLQNMPKGGDLHHHFAGDAMAENIIDYAKNDGWCINRNDFTLTQNASCPKNNLLANAPSDATLYNALINAWSMRNFQPFTESGHDHFFATFGKLFPAFLAHQGEALAEVTDRAGHQNESYIELMLIPDNNDSGLLGNKITYNPDFALMRTQLMANGLQKIIDKTKSDMTAMENKKQQLLGCGTASAKRGCDVKIAYLYSALREQAPNNIFAQLLAAFEIANQDPRFVGVNLVQPEDGYLSMRDYHLQMQMLDYLHRTYPNVHIALHAGELNSSLVPPEGLRSHIREAIELGHAERIGHGVDIAFEDNADQLLKSMAAKHILVEINLTSNDMILGVTGNHHPLPLYINHHVPIALSTDDEGVSRITLTEEYQKAILTYHFTYSEIKQFVRNSLTYSFLPSAEKNALLNDLDKRFAAFEMGFKP